MHTGTALPMVSVMAGCSVIGLVLLLLGQRTIRYRASRRAVEEDTSVLLSTRQER